MQLASVYICGICFYSVMNVPLCLQYNYNYMKNSLSFIVKSVALAYNDEVNMYLKVFDGGDH